MAKKYGSPLRLWLGPEMVVFISDAENVEIIMKSKDCLNKPNSFYKMIRDAMQVDGFFTLKGISRISFNRSNSMIVDFSFIAEDWKVHRRLVSPTINLSSVSEHLPIFNQHIRNTIAKLPENDKFFDILPYLSTCKISMFAEAALGSNIEPSVKQTYLRNFSE